MPISVRENNEKAKHILVNERVQSFNIGFIKSVKKDIEKGKNILISYDEQGKILQDQFVKILQSIFPSITFLDWDKKMPSSNYFSLFKESQEFPIPKESFISSYNKIKSEKLKNNIVKQNQFLSSELLGSYKYFHLVELINKLERKHSIPINATFYSSHQFNFQAEEYHSLNQHISRLNQLHAFSFHHNSELKNIDTEIWDLKDPEKLELKVSKFIAVIDTLLVEYLQMISILKLRLEKETASNINQYEELLEEVEICHYFLKEYDKNKETKGVFKLFAKKNVDLQDFKNYTDKILKKLNNDFTTTSYESISLENIDQIKSEICSFIEKLKNLSTEKIALDIKSLNSVNSQNNLISLWTESTDTLLKEINDNRIFKEKISKQPHNISVQFTSLSKLKLRFQILLKELNENISYHEYQNTLDILKNKVGPYINDLVLHYPKHKWEDLLSLFYFKSLLHEYHYNSFDSRNQKIVNYRSYYKRNAFAQQNLFDKKVRKGYHSALSILKKKDKNLYKKMISDSIEISISQLFSDYQDLAWNLFPIVFSHRLSENQELGAYDKIIHFGSVDNAVEMASPVIGHNLFDESIMSSILKNDILHLSKYSITQRLGFSRYISTSLLNQTKSIRIFQLKSANIISTLPNIWSDRLLNLLDSYGIKEFSWKNTEDLSKILIESFMSEGRPHHVLIKDSFFDLSNKNISGQIELFDQLEGFGIQLIDFSSLGFSYELSEYIDKLGDRSSIDYKS